MDNDNKKVNMEKTEELYEKYANLYPEDKFEFRRTDKIKFDYEDIPSTKNILISTGLNIVIFMLLLVIGFQLFFLGKYYYDLYQNKKAKEQIDIIYESAMDYDVTKEPAEDDVDSEVDKSENEEADISSNEENAESHTQNGINSKLIDSLREEFGNDDIIGYIKIEGTNIDYPILQYTNNLFYIEHGIDKASNQAGAIYMDSQNNSDFDNYNTIIYGHNMKNGSMFHNIRYYREKAYYDEHKYIETMSYDKNMKWEIFSFYQVDTSFNYIDAYFETFDEFVDLRNEFEKRSLYDTGVELEEDDVVLTLSTCTNTSDDMRFVINARLIEETYE